MTENEALELMKSLQISKDCELVKTLDFKATVIKALENLHQYRAIGTMEEVRMLKDYKELYDVYKLIGTIEEFRNLKYKKNVIPIATIEFSKEDMQKIVDEKVAQIELDIQEIRAKAIDKFVEKITFEISKNFILSMLANYENYGVISDKIVDYVIETSKKIAEQMKAGADNE